MPGSVPYKKLYQLREREGLTEQDLAILAPFRSAFVARENEFADRMFAVFMEMPEARIVLEHEANPDFLRRAWTHWFELLFEGRADDEFLTYLWQIGVRHVEVNLDQRFANLGFSIARQFCHDIIAAEIAPDQAETVSRITDKLIDFCLLVETTAYVEGSTRCDREIIKGVADRVRNRIMVIGGNIRRLMRKVDQSDPIYEVFKALIRDSDTCERMVSDISMYDDIYEHEPELRPVSVGALLGEILTRLKETQRFRDVEVEIDLDPEATWAVGDLRLLGHMFYYVLENALDAADLDRPLVRISSKRLQTPYPRIQIEIFNAGIPLQIDDVRKLFAPFYSTKATGTGFGLTIARMAVRKNHGRLTLEPVPGEGTKAVIVLPTMTHEEFAQLAG